MVKRFVLQWHLSENCNLKCLHCYQENHIPVQLSYKNLVIIYNQFKELLKKDEPVGKRIDFLIQEINRETNTIGSKSNSLEITNTVIEIKTEIENLREKIQNVE